MRKELAALPRLFGILALVVLVLALAMGKGPSNAEVLPAAEELPAVESCAQLTEW